VLWLPVHRPRPTAPVGLSISPTTISGLQVWYSTAALPFGALYGPSSGQDVPDLSGHNRNGKLFTNNLTVNPEPNLNSRKTFGLISGGSERGFQVGGSYNPTRPWTIFMVFSTDNSTPPVETVLCGIPFAAAPWNIKGPTGGPLTLISYPSGTPTTIAQSSTNLAQNTGYCIAVTYSTGGAFEVYVNAVSESSGTNNVSTSSGTFVVGRDISDTFSIDGSFAELAFYNVIVSGSNIVSLSQSFMDYYGLG